MTLKRCTAGLTGAALVACPGQDLMKVWPLPVERPWREDDIPLPPDGGGDRTVQPPPAD